MCRLAKIRESEKESHIETYSSIQLYQPGTWLQNPVKTVMKILPYFTNYNEIKILDLGSGVGRNSIPIAQYLSDKDCIIDCVDILELAIEKLKQNNIKYNTNKSIRCYNMPIEKFK